MNRAPKTRMEQPETRIGKNVIVNITINNKCSTRRLPGRSQIKEAQASIKETKFLKKKKTNIIIIITVPWHRDGGNGTGKGNLEKEIQNTSYTGNIHVDFSRLTVCGSEMV